MNKTYLLTLLFIIFTTGCSDKKDDTQNKKTSQESPKIVKHTKLSKEVKQCVLEGKPLLKIMSSEELVQTCIDKVAKEKEYNKYRGINGMDR